MSLKNYKDLSNASKQFFVLGLRFQGYDENGKEKEIVYEKDVGVEYKIFRKIIVNRIFEKYEECIHTNKIKKNKEKKN